MTLSKALVPSQSVLTKALMVAGGSVFIALAAQVHVPMWPVPVTLQTLAVLLVGLIYGARMGGLTLLAYVAEGAAGLPVFAEAKSTLALVGPSAGFIYGFVPMAFLAGLAADRGIKGLAPTALVGIAVSALLYLPGVAWPYLGLKSEALAAVGIDATKWGADTLGMIWQYYMQPFLIGDTVKAVIAALVVTGGWAALGRRAA